MPARVRRFRLAPEARQDIKEIWSYIARDSVEAAARVRQEIRDNCRRLAQHPYIGHERNDLSTREDVRFWPVYSYLIIYRPASRPLEILRVLHGERDVKRVVVEPVGCDLPDAGGELPLKRAEWAEYSSE